MEEYKTTSPKAGGKSLHYLDRFFSLNSIEELVRNKMFPNAKEVTESFAMLAAVEKVIYNCDNEISKSNPKITCIVVGDGQKPRTAALMSFLTKWTCVSIDPELRWLNSDEEIQRLICLKAKIENVSNLNVLKFKEPVLIMMPHSHAPIRQSWYNITADKKWLIRMRCCTNDELPIPSLSYFDNAVFSPKNKIEIHCNYMLPSFNNGEQ